MLIRCKIISGNDLPEMFKVERVGFQGASYFLKPENRGKPLRTEQGIVLVAHTKLGLPTTKIRSGLVVFAQINQGEETILWATLDAVRGVKHH